MEILGMSEKLHHWTYWRSFNIQLHLGGHDYLHALRLAAVFINTFKTRSWVFVVWLLWRVKKKKRRFLVLILCKCPYLGDSFEWWYYTMTVYSLWNCCKGKDALIKPARDYNALESAYMKINDICMLNWGGWGEQA